MFKYRIQLTYIDFAKCNKDINQLQNEFQDDFRERNKQTKKVETEYSDKYLKKKCFEQNTFFHTLNSCTHIENL